MFGGGFEGVVTFCLGVVVFLAVFVVGVMMSSDFKGEVRTFGSFARVGSVSAFFFFSCVCAILLFIFGVGFCVCFVARRKR